MKNGIAGIIAAVVATILVTGCQPQQQQEAAPTPNEKQARLLAVQAPTCRDELAVQKAENEVLRQKHARDVQQQNEELAKCKARIAFLQQEIDGALAERVGSLTTTLMDENASLRERIKNLEAKTRQMPGPDDSTKGP